MEYGHTEKRRTKKDLRRKTRDRVYKTGGKYRTGGLSKKDTPDSGSSSASENKKKKKGRKKGKKK